MVRSPLLLAANLTAEPFSGWITLGRQATAASLTDPLTGRSGSAAFRPRANPQVYLQLQPGESVLLHTVAHTASRASEPWSYVETAGPATALEGTWTVEFIKGGPTLPPRQQTTALKSWTELGGAETESLSGTAWSLPFRLSTGPNLKPGRNLLELEVTNLAANRIRDLDRRGVPWKIIHEINFVNIGYKPFDASAWPVTPSGLLGPVSLTPLRVLTSL